MKSASVFVVLAIALAAITLVSACLGEISFSPLRLLDVIAEASSAESTAASIVVDIRLPRIATGMIVGAALAVAGAGYQGLFRNPLADPYIIGASSGASLGITIAVLSGLQISFFGLGPISILGMLGAFCTVLVVYAIASVGGRVPTVGLLLAGVAVSSFVGAIVTLCMYLNDEHLAMIFGSLQSSVTGGGWSTVRAVAPLAVVGFLAMSVMARPLDALTFGDDAAVGLGVPVGRVRLLVVLIASLLTATAVAGGGVIGFVGLIAPHTARMLVGPSHRKLIPASALVGATLLLGADVVARMSFRPTEIPVGIVCALLGGPFFIYLLRTRSAGVGGAA